ncbi:poly-gamma-glutamate hydrolase family protein [Streptomyces sp. RKAG337]|uniref:poly-gamma-glutamate hydrolase family protein n=1 Tax=Streptomyces sp. RKAG337 TaxID=2893404 RepID=UPI00203435B0|nr:poly-gamma-glutamate hydrolase family protein [Streptomyces sp. RKAG337]MCM2427596.1 poly-gamma-glutamate hydrolase family protein [Streptomyces sp. RKAG337]
MNLNRRTLITALATAPALSLATSALKNSPAQAADETYASNTALYADSTLTEGVDYGRRSRRHMIDDLSPSARTPFVRTTVIAPHGGGIEGGTSELCFAVAGYHPADLAPTPAAGPIHDFWMFEGLRPSNNSPLHVTSTHCDDPVARSMCAGSLNVLSLHGCSASQAGLEAGAQAVLVGGLNATFRQYLMEEFAKAGIRAVTASGEEEIAGISPENICNRSLLGMGAQLETTTDLRAAMFAAGKNTRADRATNTLPLFWSFVNAVRTATERVEAAQPML